MADTEFTANRVRIDKWLQSVTRAGQVRINDGRVELLTSYGSEIDSAPVQAVRAGRSWFSGDDSASTEINGTRYRLTMADDDADKQARPTARRFIEAVRKAGGRRS
jgi:hypothetical protein